MNVFLKHGIVATFSVAFIFLIAAFLPMPAEDTEALQSVSFGYPFPFLSQDFSEYGDPILDFYRFVRFEPDRPVSSFSISAFLASFFIVLGVLEGVVYLLERLKMFLSPAEKTG